MDNLSDLTHRISELNLILEVDGLSETYTVINPSAKLDEDPLIFTTFHVEKLKRWLHDAERKYLADV